MLGCLTAAMAVVLVASPALAAEGDSALTGGPGQAVATIIIFLGLLAVLGKWAWKPLVAQLEKREQSIAKTIEDAQKRQKDAEGLLAQYRARLDKAEAEAQQLLAQSRRDAAAAREKVLAAAQEEAAKAAQSARREIEQAKQEAISELYDTTADLATDVAARLIRKNLTADDRKRMLNESLAEIRQRVSG